MKSETIPIVSRIEARKRVLSMRAKIPPAIYSETNVVEKLKV
jgi:hypothetical protein